ncbi:hypothetical protein GOP47_0027550 [Adiantum capillus-veneris]|nr:hypothetical protein GOP47_0027550 [Adiantum capillus-veneris]
MAHKGALCGVWRVAIAFFILGHLAIQGQIARSGGGGGGVASATRTHDKLGHHKQHRKGHHLHKRRSPQPRMHGESYAPYSNVFDVLSYGAIGDGETDDTQAFLGAWQQACQVENAIFAVPQYFTFVVRPIVFSGPCAPNMVFQVDGAIVAPENPSKWGVASKSLLQWITFSKMHDMQLRGGGGASTVDGRGASWWPTNCTKKGKKYEIRPTAIRFYGSYNVTVKNLKIVNSPQTHLKFDNCNGVTVSNISIHSPGYSPNTDGIHLQNTQDAEIFDSYIQNGDDCISVQTGSSNLNIHDVICEAGHGISLGGLGRAQTQACVSNVTIHDVFIRNSQNGVRIKTWQGGSGSVKSISYKNIYVVNISNPIIIDQYYCDGSKCKNQSSAVEWSCFLNMDFMWMIHFAGISLELLNPLPFLPCIAFKAVFLLHHPQRDSRNPPSMMLAKKG